MVLGGAYFQSFVCEWGAIRALFTSVNLRQKKKRTQPGTDQTNNNLELDKGKSQGIL